MTCRILRKIQKEMQIELKENLNLNNEELKNELKKANEETKIQWKMKIFRF
ncbi:MAG: hypothetical protein R3A12_04950 [Ignavibacteria bacterium]